MTRAYEEIVDFIAGGTTMSEVADWTPSPGAKQRAQWLIEAEKNNGLSPDERAELNHYLELEHLMRLAKARTRQRQADE
jgi:hypothetical protein